MPGPAPDAFAGLSPGDPFGPFTVTIRPETNERYWRAAGAEHPLLVAGALYPPIAANLTILALGQRLDEALIQTRQLITCHARVDAPATLQTMGTVVDRREHRARPYLDVRAEITAAGVALWTSEASFTTARAVTAR
jgi:hypothetical protein